MFSFWDEENGKGLDFDSETGSNLMFNNHVYNSLAASVAQYYMN